jgi:hypothetical protein
MNNDQQIIMLQDLQEEDIQNINQKTIRIIKINTKARRNQDTIIISTTNSNSNSNRTT